MRCARYRPPVLLTATTARRRTQGELSLWTRSAALGPSLQATTTTRPERLGGLPEYSTSAGAGAGAGSGQGRGCKLKENRSAVAGVKMPGAGPSLENASTVVAEDNDDVVEPTVEDNEPRDAVGLLLARSACLSQSRQSRCIGLEIL